MDPQDLRRAATVLEREAAAAGEAAAAVVRALGAGGLPGYAGQAAAGARDAGRAAVRLESLAPALRVRAVFATHAGAGSPFRTHLSVLEYSNPAGFISMLQQAAWGMVEGRAVKEGARFAGQSGAAALRWLWTPLTPAQRAKMVRDLELDASRYYKRFKANRSWHRFALLVDDAVLPGRKAATWVAAADQGRAGVYRGVPIGQVGIGVLFDTGLQYWHDREQTLSPGERMGRLGVSAGTGALAAVGVAAVCSTGVGCVALGLGAGFTAALGSNAINERFLPSDEEEEARRAAERAEREWRRQVEALNRLETWRARYGDPTRHDLQRGLAGMEQRVLSHVAPRPGEEAPQGSPPSHYQYFRPDGSLYADRFVDASGGVVSERYYRPDGRVLLTYLPEGRRG